MNHFDCSDSKAAPAIDVAGAVIYGLETYGFVLAAPKGVFIMPLSAAALSALSAKKGFADANACKKALDQLRIRQIRDSLTKSLPPRPR
jgi:hypothetical protein